MDVHLEEDYVNVDVSELKNNHGSGNLNTGVSDDYFQDNGSG